MSQPVLLSTDVLAAWMGVDPTDNSLPNSDTVHVRTRMLSDQLPDQPEGFVSATPAPEPGKLVIWDVRWSATDSTQNHEAYRQGHIPGAVYVSMTSHLAGHGSPALGRHPLPEPRDFTASVRMLGINDGDTVVIYDAVGSAAAARAWWLLRYAGMTNVYVLDGGLDAWRAADLPLQAGEVLPRIGSVYLSWGKMPVVDTAEVPEFLRAGGLLFDARAPERYSGESEPIDSVAGHIPSAISAPGSDVTDADGKFRSAAQLREHFAQLGATQTTGVAAYCGSGVTAAKTVLALALAGVEGVLYPGSWSAWSSSRDRPVATGQTPGTMPQDL
ncbi:sulfurtransferase [Yaniella halotolerans]|uniref:sulfurtransferase n=1 Tax=Yaniella halotolerans TaxID=225453 RepID=UPI0003B733E8|nr:sulfurtransferase [Yaniella halotolerans]